MTDRERYLDRKSRGVCVDCEAKTDGHARCADCLQANREARSRYAAANPEKVAARMKSLYWKDPEKFRARARQRRLDKMARGECLKCPEQAVDGSNHCAKHIAITSQAKRDWRDRKLAGLPLKKGGVRPGTPRPDGRLCSCGEPRASGFDCCARCAHLEGSGSSALVISALRGTDGMSLRELCEAMGMNSDLNNGTRQMWRWVKQLLDEGRIRRYWREDSGATIEAESYRGGKKQSAYAIGCWAYCLDGKTEREWRRAA